MKKRFVFFTGAIFALFWIIVDPFDVEGRTFKSRKRRFCAGSEILTGSNGDEALNRKYHIGGVCTTPDGHRGRLGLTMKGNKLESRCIRCCKDYFFDKSTGTCKKCPPGSGTKRISASSVCLYEDKYKHQARSVIYSSPGLPTTSSTVDIGAPSKIEAVSIGAETQSQRESRQANIAITVKKTVTTGSNKENVLPSKGASEPEDSSERPNQGSTAVGFSVIASLCGIFIAAAVLLSFRYFCKWRRMGAKKKEDEENLSSDTESRSNNRASSNALQS